MLWSEERMSVTSEVNLSDADFVESVRKDLNMMNRWRWFSVALHAIAFAGMIWVVVAWCRFAVDAPWPGMGQGFGLGLVAGIVVGMTLTSIAHSLFNLVFVAGRG